MNNFLLRKQFACMLLSAVCSSMVYAQVDAVQTTPHIESSPQARQSQTKEDLQPRPKDPRTRAKIHSELGGVYYQFGNFSVALKELQIALDLDPSYYQSYSIRGLVYGALKEYAKPEEDFKKALSIAPNDPEVNNNYGWYLCDKGNEKESIAYFLRALNDSLYETPDRAYTNAGACSIKIGEMDEAQKYLLQALQFARDGGIMPRFYLGKLFYLQGKYQEAHVYLNESLQFMEPPSPEALWLGIRLERKLGNKSLEESYAAQLRNRYPTSTEYQAFLKGNFE